MKAVNDAISKVETPVFFPSRIANTYIEIVKLLPHGGWSAYLLDKYAEKGCSDVCPFTGNLFSLVCSIVCMFKCDF